MSTPPHNDALLNQVGGSHYTKLAIQPIEYAMRNGLDGCQHNVVKYVTRFRDKGGLEDLEKAKHYLDLLIHFETKPAAADKPEEYQDCNCIPRSNAFGFIHETTCAWLERVK